MGDNNTFDKKFRNKMQDFEPDYEDAAWEKFAPQLQTTSTPFFTQTKIKSLLYSLSALAVLGIIFYFYPQKQNKSLLQNADNSTTITQNLPKGNVQLPAENQAIIPPKKENKNLKNANNTVTVLPKKQEIADIKTIKTETIFEPKNEKNALLLPKETQEKTTNSVKNEVFVKENIVENEPKIMSLPKQEIAAASNHKSFIVEIEAIQNEIVILDFGLSTFAN
jgi:hypothetical protein